MYEGFFCNFEQLLGARVLGVFLTFSVFGYLFALCMFRCFQAVHRTFDLLMLFVSMMVFYFAIWMWCLLYIYIFFVKRCDF